MQFLNPYILLVGIVIPLLAIYYILVGRRRATLRLSTLGTQRPPRTLRYWLRHMPIVLRLAALAALIVALVRPVEVTHESETTTDGIDIVLAMDISGSMLARDFQPDRLTAAKQLAAEFTANRMGDRISVVAFAGEAFTQCPLTSDQASVATMLTRLRSGIIDDGTAIGNGLATAVNRLRESSSKSKVVILLSDGVSNTGAVEPDEAAAAAAKMGVKVYAIGVGTRSRRTPVFARDIFGRTTIQYSDMTFDEKQLKSIASATGGMYFPVNDRDSLENALAEIDQLETTALDADTYDRWAEHFVSFLVPGALLVLVAVSLSMAASRRMA